jgi:hypothetical protein
MDQPRTTSPTTYLVVAVLLALVTITAVILAGVALAQTAKLNRELKATQTVQSQMIAIVLDEQTATIQADRIAAPILCDSQPAKWTLGKLGC